MAVSRVRDLSDSVARHLFGLGLAPAIVPFHDVVRLPHCVHEVLTGGKRGPQRVGHVSSKISLALFHGDRRMFGIAKMAVADVPETRWADVGMRAPPRVGLRHPMEALPTAPGPYLRVPRISQL